MGGGGEDSQTNITTLLYELIVYYVILFNIVNEPFRHSTIDIILKVGKLTQLLE